MGEKKEFQHEDPAIIRNSKDQIVNPLTRKDVEAISTLVLEDKGDEVINKAIEDGKILIPGNIDIASLPHVDLSGELSIEDFNKISGKVFCDENLVVYYPAVAYSNNDCLYFYLAPDENRLSFLEIYIEDGDEVPIVVDNAYDSLNGFGIYHHHITGKDVNNRDFEFYGYTSGFLKKPPISGINGITFISIFIKNAVEGDLENNYAQFVKYYDNKAHIGAYSPSQNSFVMFEFDSFDDTVTEL